jgi:hypothetical protein
MLCGTVLDRFVSNTPATIMVRGLMERALPAEQLDLLFDNTAETQYTRELLFSSVVNLMIGVTTRMYPSVHSAYQQDQTIEVSTACLYEKIAKIETAVSEALVRHTAEKLGPVLRQLGATRAPLIAGYKTKLIDGNHLGRSERRLKELRDVAAGPLPGQTLVVLEPEIMLATDVFCCEDGHAQERSMLDRVLARVKARDLWIADRNFCTTKFLFELAKRDACFIIRQHASTLRWQKESKNRRLGRIDTGVVYERTLWLEDEDGKERKVRQVTLVLDEPTRDGETQIQLITNLPPGISGKAIAKAYRKRWTIEHLFLNVTTILNCELKTLPYPKAELFGFCCALVAANVLATVKGALGAVHGMETVDEQVSDYHLAMDVRVKYAGMMVAVPAEEWNFLKEMTDSAFVRWLQKMAVKVDLKRYQKKPRGPKKPRPRRTRFAKSKHIATARLLAEERGKK